MHRPTYFPVKGRSDNLPTRRTCVRDLTSHTKLKVRNTEQGASDGSTGALRRQRFREELLEKEKQERLGENDEALMLVLAQEDKVKVAGFLTASSEDAKKTIAQLKDKYDDEDAISGRDSDGFDSSEDEESDADDSEDDEAALQAELEKIRAERAAAAARKEEEEREIREIEARQRAINANPLMNFESSGSSSAKLKRRWNDDTVFQNTAADEPEQKKRFINDTVRSDFHKRFMRQYLK
eukprot:GSChrysophyteH1.ASY1.ANO1.32.1 assembled CDS